MLQVKTLIIKFIAINTDAPSAISLKDIRQKNCIQMRIYVDAFKRKIDSPSNLDKITALKHKILDDSMETAFLITERVASGSEQDCAQIILAPMVLCQHLSLHKKRVTKLPVLAGTKLPT